MISIAKNPYIFYFSGVSGPPITPSGSTHAYILIESMFCIEIAINFFLSQNIGLGISLAKTWIF